MIHIYNELMTFVVYINISMFILAGILRLFMYLSNHGHLLHPIKNYEDYYGIFQPSALLSSAPITEIEIEYVREEETNEYRVVHQCHILVDAEDSKKYIGIVFEVVDSRFNVVFCCDVIMNARSFFRFPIQLVKLHLLDMVCDAETETDLPLLLATDLGRLVGDYGLMDIPSNPIIFKTYWISIIQRTWMRVYSERKRRLLLRGTLKSQRRFELCGNYGIGLGDGLKGMLMKRQQI